MENILKWVLVAVAVVFAWRWLNGFIVNLSAMPAQPNLGTGTMYGGAPTGAYPYVSQGYGYGPDDQGQAGGFFQIGIPGDNSGGGLYASFGGGPWVGDWNSPRWYGKQQWQR